MSYETVLLDKQENFATITLNRPKANALSLELVKDIRSALKEVEEDPAMRCAVITGGSGKFFSAGADVPTIGKLLDDPMVEGGLLAEGIETMNAIEACAKPVIAAVNGVALGGGCELALACHIRIASEQAVFGQPEITLGIIPGWGGTYRLPRAVGEARAAEWLLTGRTVNAQEALLAGLVCKVVSGGQLMEAAGELSNSISGLPAVAMRATLDTLRKRPKEPGRAQAIEAEAFAIAAASKDAREGVGAFLEKRKPKFTNE